MPLDPYDYVRIQAQLDFQCTRCGICCQVADPIDIYPKDIRRLSSHFNISIEEAVEEYTIPHPTDQTFGRSKQPHHADSTTMPKRDAGYTRPDQWYAGAALF
jgi:hypothetical protein